MEWRKNQGFIIVNQITVGGAEFVLGVHEKNPNSFVTWQCKGKTIIFGDIILQICLRRKKTFADGRLMKSRLLRV